MTSTVLFIAGAALLLMRERGASKPAEPKVVVVGAKSKPTAEELLGKAGAVAGAVVDEGEKLAEALRALGL